MSVLWIAIDEKEQAEILINAASVLPVLAVKVRERLVDRNDPRYEKFFAAARVRQKDGEIEFDKGASISYGSDPGAYIQGWVWIYNDEAGIDNADLITDSDLKKYDKDMTKIVVNRCFGGYSLSKEAYAELGLEWDGFGFEMSEDRDNPKLVAMVEKLGEAANGPHSDLQVIEIPDDVEWEIDDYDGMESVHEKHRSW